MTTTEPHPMRPHGAGRHVVTTAAAAIDAQPQTRRARRVAEHHGRRRAASTASATGVLDTVARSMAAGVRSAGSLAHGVSMPRIVPITAVALVASLVVAVSSPQSALASPAEDTSTAVYDLQQFTAPSGVLESAGRDRYGVTTAPAKRTPPPAASASGSATAPAGVAFVRPVAGTVPAAGGFGSRWVAGCGACSTNHQGLDFAAPTGTAVVSAMAGTVVLAGWEGGYGNSVVVQHAGGVQTRYAHLSAITVRVGQSLPVGARVGSVGSTGVSTGSHLHFEVIVDGTPVDPAGWLRSRGLF